MSRYVRNAVVSLAAAGLLAMGATAVHAEQSEGCPKTCPKSATCPQCKEGFKPLFDGKTLNGWEGDQKLWSVKDGMLIGRTTGDLKHNEFLWTTKEYGDFMLYVKFRLVDGKGNSGFQIRSKKIPDRIQGYQADVGQDYWGWLYDEARRGKLAGSPADTKKHYKPDGWNEYLITCKGPDIELKLNGFTTVKYTEKDPKIPLNGVIAVQLHVGHPMEIQVKCICIKELKGK
ncbi:MAG: DUF1080 domain-containing protein [Phycisphaerae bacterium]|nr:DUF1080 domain-containing protein [Phycisphaerae bacterium]